MRYLQWFGNPSNYEQRKALRVWLFLPMIFLLFGCINTEVLKLDEFTTYEPSTEVGILFRNPSRAFVTLATLEATGSIGETHQTVLQDLRENAKKLGAHAIIILQNKTEPKSITQGRIYQYFFKDYEKVMGDEDDRTIKAIAIRFVD